MMMPPGGKWRRRGVVLGAASLLAGGLALNWRRLFAKHYPPTPYDDVLKRLTDREWAEKFGASVLKTMPVFPPATAAARLRELLGKGSLKDAALRDAQAGRVLEITGWIVPESAALLAGLAASQA
jgi:hypothetical protein